MINDLRKMAEAATPEAIAKRLRDRALRMEGDPDGVVGNATWLANTAADTIDALTARVAELEGQPDVIGAVPREPTKEMWGNDLVRALIFWQRTERPTPSKLFLHCKNCGVAVPQWLSDEPEMKNLDHVTSKGTVAVLIYRAMLAQAGKE